MLSPTINGTFPSQNDISSPALPERSTELGKDEFLRLLVTQLQNQDPLNPMEGQEFAAQLAQFSSVEALVNIEDTLVDNTEMSGLMTQTMNSSMAASFIGREVEALSNQVGWSGSGEATIGYDLGENSSKTTLTIRDTNGAILNTIDLGAQRVGSNTFDWDGTDQNGRKLEPGTYEFEITAEDNTGDTVSVTPFVQATVDRVRFGPEGILLWMQGVASPLTYVRSVQDGN